MLVTAVLAPVLTEPFRDGRIWVTLGNEPLDALTIISDCISQLDLNLNAKATTEAARAELATLLQDKSVLFVIDDVWPGKSVDVARLLLVPSPRSRFLLTTRFSQLANDPGIRAKDFALDEMSSDQAKELVVRVLGRDLAPHEISLAKHLADIVGGHPFAIELSATRVRENRSWAGLLHDLGAEVGRLEVLDEEVDNIIEPAAINAREKGRSVRASLFLSLRVLSEKGRQLFAWLGVLSEDAVS